MYPCTTLRQITKRVSWLPCVGCESSLGVGFSPIVLHDCSAAPDKNAPSPLKSFPSRLQTLLIPEAGAISALLERSEADPAKADLDSSGSLWVPL